MNVFVTGATGWVGSAVVQDLIGAGHRVVGLAREDVKADRLAAQGVQVLRGTLEDLAILRKGAEQADAVIHTAFNHDFSKFMQNIETDRIAIETLGSVLLGSARPLLVTSGLSGLKNGATELDLPSPHAPRKSEAAARTLAEQGLRAATVRLAPSVHGIGEHGFVPIVIRLAREKGVSAYVGEGQNCWAGTHRLDAARVYRLALEQGVTEAVYHAVAEERIPFVDIARCVGKKLGVPVESLDREHFGWFANMAAGEMSVSSERTRKLLAWTPTGPGLFDDLEDPSYYAV